MPVAALAIGGIGSIVGGVLGSNAAGHAADVQAQAANQAAQVERQNAVDALNFSKQQYGNTLQLVSPYYGIGTSSLNRLAYLMGLPGSPQTFDPNHAGAVLNGTAQPSVTGRVPISQLLNGGDFVNPRFARNGVGGGGVAMPFSADGAMVPATGGTRLSALMNPGAPFAGRINGINPIMTGTAQIPNGGFGFNGGVDTGDQGGASFNNGSLMVPRIDGGGATVAGGGAGDFGSLARPFGEQFTAPTDVTEQNDPGFQFRLQEGQKALERSAAARGGLLTGGTAKAINDYAQQRASDEFNNVYNRSLNTYQTRYNAYNNDQNTQFNRFAALAGLGQTASGQLQSAGVNAANNNANILLSSAGQIGQQLNNAAAARGSGYVGQANALSGMFGGLSQLPLLYQMM